MSDSGLGWLDVGKIVLASGVVSAFVSQGLQWLKESRKDAKKFKAEASLNAIGLVGVLDRYVAQCHSKVQQYDQDPSYYLESKWCYPPDLDLSQVKLEFFSAEVLAKLAWLKTERFLALDQASGAMDRGADLEGYQDHCVSITGYSGYEIAMVAKLIRQQHKLPELSSGWSLENKIVSLRPFWQRAKDTLQ